MRFDALEIRSDQGRTVHAYLAAPCVCGSSMQLRYCCGKGGRLQLRSQPSPTAPAPPSTGYSHGRCYARALNDCSEQISKEHYLSRGVLRELAGAGPTNTVRMSGMGLPEGDLPPDQVGQAKILCGRHNSALSALDTAGARLFRALREGIKTIPAFAYRSFSGVDVERWLLKVTCGVRAASKQDVPLEWLEFLFGSAELPPMLGLYMHVRDDHRVTESLGIQFATYTRADGPSGGELVMDGVRFTLDLRGDRGTHRPEDIGSLKIYRPNGIWFDHFGAATFLLGFEWGDRIAAPNSVVVEVQHG